MINIFKNVNDNECFKWILVRYLNTADCIPIRITKADKKLARELDSKGIKLPVKIRDIYWIKKKELRRH